MGKMFGSAYAMKGGLGMAGHRVLGTDVVVGTIAAVNAVGDVSHPDTRQIIAGSRREEGRDFGIPWQLSWSATVLSPRLAATR